MEYRKKIFQFTENYGGNTRAGGYFLKLTTHSPLETRATVDRSELLVQDPVLHPRVLLLYYCFIFFHLHYFLWLV